jgi:hypothetical protein
MFLRLSDLFACHRDQSNTVAMSAATRDREQRRQNLAGADGHHKEHPNAWP